MRLRTLVSRCFHRACPQGDGVDGAQSRPLAAFVPNAIVGRVLRLLPGVASTSRGSAQAFQELLAVLVGARPRLGAEPPN